MALAVDGSTPAAASNTGGLPVTTAAFTPPSGSLVVALVAYNTDSGVADNRTVTATGLTFTLQGRKNSGAGSIGGAGRSGGCEVWTAIGAGASVQVVSSQGTSSAQDQFVQAVVLTGNEAAAGGAIAAASSASGLPSVTVVTTRDNSLCLAISSDWAAAGAGTAGTGVTIISETTVSGQYTAHAFRRTAAAGGSGSSVICNLTAPSAQEYNLLGYEVREPAGAAAAAPARPVVAPSRAATQSASW